MDEKYKILLNSEKNINSVDVDNYNKIELLNKSSLKNEYDVKNILSVTELFEKEREETNTYRIYGRIELMSLLNGLDVDYREINELFFPTLNSKNIFNSFDFYLVRPSNDNYKQFTGHENQYFRAFKVLATPNNFEIYNAGFSKNVYNEQIYAFNINIDINISNYLDYFNFPLTELFIYAQYKPRINFDYGDNDYLDEKFKFKQDNNFNYMDLTPKSFSIGDYLENDSNQKENIVDLIEYNKKEFVQKQIMKQTFEIVTPMLMSVDRDPSQFTSYYNIHWNYNPFIPIRLRHFDNKLIKLNKNDNTHNDLIDIPYYATDIENDNFVWREILPDGYTDPLTGIGVDHPFVNKRKYVFNTITLDVYPNMENPRTKQVFNEIFYEEDKEIDNKLPISDIDDITKPCR